MPDTAKHLLHTGLTSIQGPLIFLRGVRDAGLYERVEVLGADGTRRMGRVVSIADRNVVVEVFQGSDGLSIGRTQLRFLSEPVMLDVGSGMLGRVYNGVGQPIDGGPPPAIRDRLRVDGNAINPVRREVPSEFIETGISAIDAMNSLVRGQKLPIFSGSGLNHDRLASSIARFARLRSGDTSDFADRVRRHRRHLRHRRALPPRDGRVRRLERMALFLNLASDPSAERLLTPSIALTAAEYLAYSRRSSRAGDPHRHDQLLRGPARDIVQPWRGARAARDTRATCTPTWPPSTNGPVASAARAGSITQIPILTMPNDDITHPIPDLSGYITEGQIVLDRDLERRGIFPPIALLPCLSRLMNKGIGPDTTAADHPALASQLYAAYAHARHLKLLSNVVGEEGLSESDRALLRFGEQMENDFLQQGDQRRTLEETFDVGWRLLAHLPDEILVRLSDSQIAEHVAPRRHG